MSRGRTRKTKQLSNDEQFEIDFGSVKKPMNEQVLLQTLKVEVKCKTENQKALVNSVRDNIFTIVNGLAGTGKTYLACAEALRLMIHDEKIKKIVLVKSITPLKGEDIGSLPGDIKDKMGPIMESFMDNIKKIVGLPIAEKLLEFGFIEVLPIAFARGRSIDNAVIIIDEAQNISIDNIRTLMTRIGTDSKVVILGDVKQKDIRNKRDSSLGIVLERFRNVNGFGCVELRSKEDIVRHPLIQVIDEIFDDILGE
jgi:phosphate starvation-inducible PhoH-like protein